MFTRRHLIKAAGAGLALTGSGLKPGSARAAGAAIDLPATLPEGGRNNVTLDSLPGPEAADQAQLSAAELRNVDRIFPDRHHAK